MHRIKIDFSKTLPWRNNYAGETEMPYGGDRIHRVTTGGGRDASATIAGSRQIMAGGFANGELTPLYPTERGELNGLEKDYVDGDWGTFLSGEGDQIILDVIKDDLSFSDHIIVIHGNAVRQSELSVTRIPKMMKHHSSYGFDIIPVEGLDTMLQPGTVLRAGTRLSHTRATMANGGYGHGREANCASISSFSTNEDTCSVYKSVCEDFASVGVEEFTIMVNNENVPLDVDRGNDVWRAIPRVGDILHNGVVMTTRSRRRDAYLSQRTKKAMKQRVVPFDLEYSCKRGGEVISVEVIKATTSKCMNRYIPTNVVRYLDNAAAQSQNINHRILTIDKEYRKRFGDNYKPTATFNMLVRQAITNLFGPKLKNYYKNIGKDKEVHGTLEDNNITGYQVRVKVRSVIKPHLGHKFNDAFGAKYTISEIRDENRMFKDEYGRIAEFITNGVANINRGIWGRLAAPYRGDTRFHLLRNMRKIAVDEGFEAAKEYYLGGIKVLSDKTYWMLTQLNEDALNQHVNYIINEAPFIQVTDEVGDESLTVTGTQKIRKSQYAPPRGRLTFHTYRGVEVQTVNAIRIAPMYISINEKIGSDYSASNIPMRQHSGINRKLSSQDKKTTQISESSSRAYGESDFRMTNDNLPAEDAKIVMRDATSQSVVKETFDRILDGEMVPDVDVSKGDSRGMEVMRAELACDGVELTNIPRAIRWKRDE